MCKYFTVSFSIQKEADPILGEAKLAAVNLVQGRDSLRICNWSLCKCLILQIYLGVVAASCRLVTVSLQKRKGWQKYMKQERE